MVYVYLGEGFEEIEALTCVDLLRRAKIEVSTVSVGERIVTGAHGIKVTADMLITEASMDKCQMIVLPGGMPGTLNLQNSPTLSSYIDDFYKEGKYIAAICAAPMILGAKGYLDGKPATIYPGMEDHLGAAIAKTESVVQSDNIITGRGPGCAMDFALKIIEVLKGSEISKAIADELVYKTI